MPDSAGRVLRTLIQLLAAGAFTELFLQVAKDVPEHYAPYILIFSTLAVTAAQNTIEEKTGKAFLKPANAAHAKVKV